MVKPAGIKSLTISDYIKLMVVGEYDVGKTQLAGTSDGLILHPPTDHVVSAALNGSKAQQWVMRDWADMDAALEYLRRQGHADYRWAWLDSISIMQEYGLDDVYADTIARKGGPDSKGGQDRMKFNPDKQEYGINMHRLGVWVRHACAVPMHFGITAMPFDDGEKIKPYIQGKNMALTLPGYMNVIGHLIKRKGGQRALITKNRRKADGTEYYAKDQYDALGGMLLDPTIPMIEELVSNKLAEARPRRRRTRNG